MTEEKIIKEKRTIEYYRSVCSKCGKIIEGAFEDQVKYNMAIHRLSCLKDKKNGKKKK